MKEYYATENCRKINRSRMNIYVLIYVVFFVLVLLLSKTFEFLWFFPFGLLFLYSILSNTYRFKEKLVISEKHIEYDGINYSIRIDWKRTEKIIIRKELAGVQECLVTDYDNIELLTLKTRSTPREFIIPLSCFSENWRDSELGQQIKQYAPHLFEKSKSVQSA